MMDNVDFKYKSKDDENEKDKKEKSLEKSEKNNELLQKGENCNL